MNFHVICNRWKAVHTAQRVQLRHKKERNKQTTTTKKQKKKKKKKKKKKHLSLYYFITDFNAHFNILVEHLFI